MEERTREKVYKVLSLLGMGGLILYVVYSQFLAPKQLKASTLTEETVRVKTEQKSTTAEAVEEVQLPDSNPGSSTDPEPEPKGGQAQTLSESNSDPEKVKAEGQSTEEPPESVPPEEPIRHRTLDNLTPLDLDFIEGFTAENKRVLLEYRSQVGRSMTWDDVLQVPGLSPLAVENLRRWLDGH